MKSYKNQHGFSVTNQERIEEVDATLVDMTHEKSGARLIYLDRRDENTTFCITFKTTPTDDTGVFHILEHSVLCGSKKFPVKDPFTELLKGSMSTYLNALTAADKTMYPVSSKNAKAFHGLVDVYLDAVFNPLALENPYIFMQEGHRLEFDEDGDLDITGVVYNEMQGVYASADDYADYLLSRLNSPGGTYSYDSGGNPDFIPKLSYEDFKAAHEKFYHPSNACLFLDGDVDLDDILPLIDSYLSAYDKRESDIEVIDGQPPITEIMHEAYPIEEEDDPKDKNRIYISYNIFEHHEYLKLASLSLAAESVADLNNAPLTKRILDTGLCESFSFYNTRSYKVNALNVIFMGVKDGKEEELIRKYDEALFEVLSEGISKDTLLACLKRREFNVREADGGSYPKGMSYMRACIENAMFGESVADSLRYEDALKFFYEKIDTDHYTEILREAVSNPRSTLILHPDATFNERKTRELWEKLDKLAKEMTEEEKAALITASEGFRKWQNTPDSPEKLNTLPLLSLTDINPEPKKIPIEVKTHEGAEIILHAIDTKGISYADMYFDISDANEDEVHYIRLFCDLIFEWNTKLGDSNRFRSRTKKHLGSFFITTAPIYNHGTVKHYIQLHHSCLESEEDNATDIIKEYLNDTLYDSIEVLKKNLKQFYLYSAESIIARGDSFANFRTTARYSQYEALMEHTSGYEYHIFLKDLSQNIDTKAEEVLERLNRINNKYFKRERLTVGLTKKDGEGYARRLVDLIPTGGEASGPCPVKTLEKINEGIAIPGTVAFVMLGTNLNVTGADERRFSGEFFAYQSIASLEILWNEIRVKNGAYDVGYFNHPTGTIGMKSYRDPSPMASLEYFKRLPEKMSDFIHTAPDISKFIIGIFGSMDTVTTPHSDGSLATRRYLSGTEYETIVKRRTALLRTTLDDLSETNRLIEKTLEGATYTVVASRDTLDKFGEIERILEI